MSPEFYDGDRVTPIGWMLSTPKPVGVVVGGEYKHPLTGQRLVLVKWDDVPDTRHLSPSVIERVHTEEKPR